MINLRQYIFEKFRISKNTNLYQPLEHGNVMVRVCIYGINTESPWLEIGGARGRLTTFGEIKNDRVYFNNFISNRYDDYYEYEKGIFINDKGFYETPGETSKKSESVYLPVTKDILDFIGELKKFNKTQIQDDNDIKILCKLLSKYFDSSTELPSKNCTYRIDKDKLNAIYDEIDFYCTTHL